jgi:molybdate transport system substrate-binding protein
MRKPLAAGLAVLTAMVLPACGNSTAPAIPPGSSAAGLSGSLTVFAAASLTEAFNDAKTGLVADNPGFSLTYSFAGSQQLVAQITNAAPADVVATADQDSMSKLVAGSLVEPPTDFAANSLQIVVPAGNPNAVRGLADLARANLKVVLADASVPAGKYARQALDKAGTKVKPVSLELDVKAVLRKVASGEADAGIVYLSDVATAGTSVAGVDIPPAQNVVATYPVAVVKGTSNHGAAQAFVDQLLRGRGRDALAAHGFGGV